MGYRSDFELRVVGSLIPYDQKEFLTSLDKISGYSWEDHYAHDDTQLETHLYNAKWYDCFKHLTELSSKYPDLQISCHAEGEDRAQIIFDAFSGIVDERCGEMIFPPRTLWT